MSRVRFVEHRGHRILFLDFSGIRDREVAMRAMAEAKQTVAREAPRSVLALTLVAGSSFTPEILGALRDLAAHNQPYVRARAIVGVSGLQWVAHAAISWALQQDLPVFKTVAAAMDWLVEQAGQAPSNWDPARRDSLDCTFPAAD